MNDTELAAHWRERAIRAELKFVGATVAQQYVRAIKELTREEADSVTIVADNADFDGPNSKVECRGAWTDFIDKTFSGDSVLDCLLAAVEEHNPTIHVEKSTE